VSQAPGAERDLWGVREARQFFTPWYERTPGFWKHPIAEEGGWVGWGLFGYLVPYPPYASLLASGYPLWPFNGDGLRKG